MKNNKNNINIGGSNTEKFIPTMAQWWELRQAWEKKMAGLLWRHGTVDECKLVVQYAFDKFMGIHPEYKLKDNLKPLYIGQWYKMVFSQAKWIMTHHQKHDWRLVGCSTSDENEVGMFGVTEYDIAAVCSEEDRYVIRKVIADVCRRNGFKEKAICGFFKTKLDGMRVRKAMKEVLGYPSENALNQSNKRIFEFLKHTAKDPSGNLYKLWWGMLK